MRTTAPTTIAATAALLGAADTALFLARRPSLFSDAPRRAGGSVGVLALWLGVAAAARSHRRVPAVGLAALNAAGQAAMLGIHRKHHIDSPRVWAGAALGSVALAATAVSR